jgi:hypothetical protein
VRNLEEKTGKYVGKLLDESEAKFPAIIHENDLEELWVLKLFQSR